MGWPFSLRIFSEKATSWAVSGLPSWNVMPGRSRKTISEPVGRYLHRARSEAVQRVGFVLGARHQAREGELYTLRTISLKDEAVERIEGEKVLIEGPSCPDVGEYATLRGFWIDVIEMLEVGRIFEIAEGRNPMALGVV